MNSAIRAIGNVISALRRYRRKNKPIGLTNTMTVVKTTARSKSMTSSNGGDFKRTSLVVLPTMA
jgi:hypothetical protein